jgi:cellobiose-specific phosphotransferase system component IIA
MSRAATTRALTGLIAAVSLAAAVPATADEPTRESYAEAAEPICKVNTQANERILAGVRALVKQGKYAVASAKFTQAATALKKAHMQLKVLPQPAADQARLKKWLAYIEDELAYFKAAASKLKAGNKSAAGQIVIRLNHTATLANNQVLGFDFEYCRLDPSRFT